MELFRYLIFFLMLLGFLSVLLWPPALCLGLFLLVRERRTRPALGGLFAVWALSLCLALCLPWVGSGPWTSGSGTGSTPCRSWPGG